ncbi:unnamed protein product [Closterium sp. NIES-53]
MAHGPAHWKFGKLGDGGVDIQRQTMRKHALSQKHQDAVNAKLRAEGGKVDQRGIEQFENDDNEMSRLKQLMLVVLFICTYDSPISLYVDLVRLLAELQTPHIPDKAIGTYQSAYGFCEITEAIVTNLKQQQMRHIQASPFLGIQLDESTDRRRGKHMIDYLSFIRNAEVVTELFGHLTVEKCDASSLLTVLLAHLAVTGVDIMKLSGISTDGASVMRGSQAGVATQLKLRVPHLVMCHCIAHMEALAAKDAAEAVPDLNMVDTVVRSVAENLGRSIVLHSRFMELQHILHETSLEVQGFKDHGKKAYATVTSFKFHFFLFFLADVLKLLNDLNLKFQRRTVSTCEVRADIYAYERL